MRPTATAAVPAALVIPAGVLHLLPAWAVLVVVAFGLVLTAAQVIVTQAIRWRASSRITGSTDNVHVLEIEDLPHHRRRDQPEPGQAVRRLPRRRSGSHEPPEDSATGASSPDRAYRIWTHR